MSLRKKISKCQYGSGDKQQNKLKWKKESSYTCSNKCKNRQNKKKFPVSEYPFMTF